MGGRVPSDPGGASLPDADTRAQAIDAQWALVRETSLPDAVPAVTFRTYLQREGGRARENPAEARPPGPGFE